jgi:Ca-activated chloride channel family protein
MFRFAHPLWLIAVPLLPVLLVALRKRRQPAALQYSDVSLVEDLPRPPRLRLRWVPDVLRIAALVLVLVAIARPQSARHLEIIRGRGVDIVIALDISGSMAALDFEPTNRLGAAKQVIDGFISKRRYDRIGLVVFAREAFSQSPPTFDYAVLRRFLGETDLAPELGLEDGTAIGLGLVQAAAMLEDSDAESRVIILLTDGVNNAGQIDPLTAAQLVEALDIRIYTVGAARPGRVPIPVDDPFFGSTTQMIDSEIDEETLQRIAENTGGQYYRAEDTTGLKRIYDEIDSLEKSEVEVQVFTRYKELSGWLLLPALGLILLERLLRSTLYRTLP